MKQFLTTTKGKVISGVVTVAAIAAVVIAIISLNSGYRTIAVESINGTTKVSNSGSQQDAYLGQHLKSGDDVSVQAQSDLTLGLDSDKYVYAKENTHFWIEALGKKNNTRTTIKLDNGSSLCRIDTKLNDTESFEVDTPNSTMSVRGTVFKVESYRDDNGDRYTVVDVFEGSVFIQVKMESGQNTEENRLLKAGERAVIRSNNDVSEFIKNDETGNIEYKELTKEEAIFLGKAIDDGRMLSISKELLYDIVEINEHDYSSKGYEVAATCTEEGYYYDVCSVCGAEGEKHAISKLDHDWVEDAADSTKRVCFACGAEDYSDEESNAKDDQEEKQDSDTVTDDSQKNDNASSTEQCKNGHSFEKKRVEATCQAEGYEEDECSVCGAKQNRVVLEIKKHEYVITKQNPTCTSDGLEYHTCKYCQDKWADVIKSTGHDYVTSDTAPTCTTDGVSSKVCSLCGEGTSQTIPATGHTRGSMTWDGYDHWYVCSSCGIEIDKAGHSFDPTNGACSVCGFH